MKYLLGVYFLTATAGRAVADFIQPCFTVPNNNQLKVLRPLATGMQKMPHPASRMQDAPSSPGRPHWPKAHN